MDEERILKRLTKALARSRSEAVKILLPPEQQATSGATPRTERSPGDRTSGEVSSREVGLAVAQQSRNRQVSELLGRREAPASHTWRGLTAVRPQVALELLKPSKARSMPRPSHHGTRLIKSADNEPSSDIWPPGKRQPKRILNRFRETSCAYCRLGSRNSFTVKTGSESRSDPRAGGAGKP